MPRNFIDGLNYVATWNGTMLISDAIKIALKAQQAGETPSFEH